MKGVASRKLAVDILVKVERDGAFVNLASSAAFDKTQLSERDRAFVMHLVQGVLRNRSALDAQISAISTQPLAKMTPHLRNLLRLAIFQLEQMSDTPPSAVLNTAVEVAKQTGHVGTARFANGILRAFVRKHPPPTTTAGPEVIVEPDETEQSQNEAADSAKLSELYSMPLWLVDKWLAERGLDETVALLKYCQQVPSLTVRTNQTAITPEALFKVFQSSGITAKPGELVPSCLTITDRGKHKGSVEKLPGYTDGFFSIQDEAAAFVAVVLDAHAGDFVIDMCAAPGGKSVQIGEVMENKGRVLAIDINENRLNLLRKIRPVIGLTNIELLSADATTYKTEQLADRVLLDAPCSGTGVINRKTDLRFKRTAPDLANLVELQRKLLTNATNMVKPGGILVYSTCSIEPEENEENLNWFLQSFPHFSLQPLLPFVPEPFQAREPIENWNRGWVQLLPNRHGVSGFFVARLQKSL